MAVKGLKSVVVPDDHHITVPVAVVGDHPDDSVEGGSDGITVIHLEIGTEMPETASRSERGSNRCLKREGECPF